MIEWHAIYKEDGTVRECYFVAAAFFEEAEQEFKALHPKATYWELGRPLKEVTPQ